MNRAQRSRHFVIWLLMVPVLVAVLWVGWSSYDVSPATELMGWTTKERTP